MSIRGTTEPCPHCGDGGPWFLVRNNDGPCYAKGYRCGVCHGYWDARESDKADHPDDFVPWPEEPKPQLTIVRPKIEFSIETRPSVGTGFSWWGVLTYGTKTFLELLPQDFPALSDEQRDVVLEEVLPKLKAQLMPVLLAEDGNAAD